MPITDLTACKQQMCNQLYIYQQYALFLQDEIDTDILLGYHCWSVVGVVSPRDKVTEELKVMKETVNSIQASLITSVSLIQGKEN